MWKLIKVPLKTPFFAKINLCAGLKLTATSCSTKCGLFIGCIRLQKVAIFCYMTKLIFKNVGQFLVWHHRLIGIEVSLCKYACKTVCDVNWGKMPLLTQLCAKWCLYCMFWSPLETQSKRLWNVGTKYYICNWKHKFGFKVHFTKCKLGCK